VPGPCQLKTVSCSQNGRIFAGIDATNTEIEHSHLEVADEARSAVKGGFHYGLCRRPVVYLPPRPLMNHGPHRCESDHQSVLGPLFRSGS
jgi:hypothetical protein